MTGPAGGGLVPLTDAEAADLCDKAAVLGFRSLNPLIVRLLAERDVLRRLVWLMVDGVHVLIITSEGAEVLDENHDYRPLAEVDADAARVLADVLAEGEGAADA